LEFGVCVFKFESFFRFDDGDESDVDDGEERSFFNLMMVMNLMLMMVWKESLRVFLSIQGAIRMTQHPTSPVISDR
jgi:hypothetical protein